MNYGFFCLEPGYTGGPRLQPSATVLSACSAPNPPEGLVFGMLAFFFNLPSEFSFPRVVSFPCVKVVLFGVSCPEGLFVMDKSSCSLPRFKFVF